ncbi:DUF1636 family protein [Methyloceanibacter stevinii]|uniref:DUF1636 family protein n=1 Tax=Methyloceanibacter stevinii TaxID=1774970 RepID=UPI003138CFAC
MPQAGRGRRWTTRGAPARRGHRRGAHGTGVTVRQVECLANCRRSLSAAMRKKDSWTYVFGDLTAPDDATALIDGAMLLAESDDGLLPWRGRPEALKGGLVARVPPLVLGPIPEDFE